jgi:hypothetical protein
MPVTLLAEITSYDALFSGPPRRSRRRWQALERAEQLTRQALQAVTAAQLSAFTIPVWEQYTRLRLAVRQPSTAPTHWAERKACLREARLLLQVLASQCPVA